MDIEPTCGAVLSNETISAAAPSASAAAHSAAITSLFSLEHDGARQVSEPPL
jgi:hypothetical protein